MTRCCCLFCQVNRLLSEVLTQQRLLFDKLSDKLTKLLNFTRREVITANVTLNWLTLIKRAMSELCAIQASFSIR